jgi:hypothetical protein
MANYARIRRGIEVSKRRLEHLKQEFPSGRGYQPRKVLRPNMAAVRALSRDIEALFRSHPRYLNKEQTIVVLRTIERLHRRQQHLEKLIFDAQNRLKQIEFRTRWTNRIVQGRDDLDQLLVQLLARKGCNGSNIHASAMGKAGAIKRKHRNPNTFRELGLKGAAARWAKVRAAQAAEASSEPSAP